MREPRGLVVTALVAAALAALCIVAFDEPFARWLAGRETWPALWSRGIAILEYPLGIVPWKWTGACVLVAGVLATLTIERLRPYAHAWVLVALVHLLARNLSFWLKWATGRLRPTQWLDRGGDTFWREEWSFPSGHVILFASVVLPIVVVYPRARPLLVVVAFAMTARVAVNAHFLSDVFAGLALAAAVTFACAVVVRRVLPWPTPPASPR